jgi:hypothetical protein
LLVRINPLDRLRLLGYKAAHQGIGRRATRRALLQTNRDFATFPRVGCDAAFVPLTQESRHLRLLFTFLRIEIDVLIIGLAAIVAFRLLTGAINTGGLLFDKTVGKDGEKLGTYSPARLQLLMLTMAAAFFYFSLIVSNLHAGLLEFPDLPEKWLLILGGSHSLYLGGKTYSLLGGPSQGPNVNQK